MGVPAPQHQQQDPQHTRSCTGARLRLPPFRAWGGWGPQRHERRPLKSQPTLTPQPCVSPARLSVASGGEGWIWAVGWG